MSFVLSFLRAIYMRQEPKWVRRFLESAICGMITLSSGFAIDAMGIHGDWKYAVAGAIGFLGVDFIRTLLQRVLTKRAGL